MNWTEEHLNKIVKLSIEGMTYGEIAAQMGVSRNALLGIVRRKRLSLAASHAAPNSNQRKWLEIQGGFRRTAGIRNDNKPDLDVLEARLAERPEDTRDLTGIVFGDPIPGDTRRTWAPHLAGGR